MAHFHKLASGFAVADAASELAASPPAVWVPMHKRPDFAEVVAAGYYPPTRVDPQPEGHRVGSLLVDGKPAANAGEWPEVERLLAEVIARFGDVSEVSASVRIMPPQSRIAPHTDNFANRKKARVHLAIQCDDKAVFTIAQERRRFEPGDLWLVDLRGHTHSVNNRSDASRMMLMIDVPLAPSEVKAAFAA